MARFGSVRVWRGRQGTSAARRAVRRHGERGAQSLEWLALGASWPR